MIIVIEPGMRSIDCAASVVRMAGEIGIKNFAIVANKVSSDSDKSYIDGQLASNGISGGVSGRTIPPVYLPFSDGIRNADRDGVSALDGMNDGEKAVIESLIDTIWKGQA